MALKDLRVKTIDVIPSNEKKFEDFSLKENLLKGIYQKGWKLPSPIQEKCIPISLTGRDILARAKSGTGKTGAYLISIIEKINNALSQLQAIIIVPNRELALQTSQVAIEISKYLDICINVTTGGADNGENLSSLKDMAQLIIATPGRAHELIRNSYLKMDKCSMLVLDEADILLSEGFVHIVKYVIDNLPDIRQIMLYSATFSISLNSLNETFLKDPYEVNIMDELMLKGITQYFTYVEEESKVHCLITLFGHLEICQVIVFCKSVQRVELLAKKISQLGYSCYYVHARMPQHYRNRIFDDFLNNKCKILICTDIFARGIDIPNVNVVINFDLPKYPEIYLHRIGRCGRFGHLGIAISCITKYDLECINTFQNQLNTNIIALPKSIEKYLYVPAYQIETEFDDKTLNDLRHGIFT